MASKMISFAAFKVLALAVVFAATGVQAQEIEPRAYSNVPIGVNFLITSYAHAEGGLTVDPSVQLTNPEIRTDIAVLAYARSVNVWGQSEKFSVIVPYAWTSGTAEFAGQSRERKVSGSGDARFRFPVNHDITILLKIRNINPGFQ